MSSDEQVRPIKATIRPELEKLIAEFKTGRFTLCDSALEDGDLKVVDGDLAFEPSGSEEATPEKLVQRAIAITLNGSKIHDTERRRQVSERIQPSLDEVVRQYRAGKFTINPEGKGTVQVSATPEDLADMTVDRVLIEVMNG